MKGVIAKCLSELVKEKFGEDKWGKIMEKAGMSPNTIFVNSSDIPDEAVMKVVKCTCEVLGITPIQAADAFGDYWVNVFAKKLYSTYFARSKTAKEMLLNMDSVHKTVTQTVPNAHPPHFEYEWKNDKTLIMHYKSNRGLIDFLVGLIKGVGKYYNENLRVTKLASDKVEVVFP